MHIYRLVSEATIEENILLKARQKRQLADMTVEQGQFTTASLFASAGVRDLVGSGAHEGKVEESGFSSLGGEGDLADADFLRALAAAEDDDDRAASKAATAEARAEMAEFDEPVVAPTAPGIGGIASAAGVSGASAAASGDANDDEDDQHNDDVNEDEKTDAKALSSKPRGKGKMALSGAHGDAASEEESAESSMVDSDESSESDDSDNSSSSSKTGDVIGDVTANITMDIEHGTSLAKPSAKRVKFSGTNGELSTTNAPKRKGKKTPRGDSFAQTLVVAEPSNSSALDRIDLDALELETTAAEEGLEDELLLQQQRAASGSTATLAAKGVGVKGAKQPTKTPNAVALFDAVTTGAGAASAAPTLQRDRVAIAMAKFSVVAASLQVRACCFMLV